MKVPVVRYSSVSSTISIRKKEIAETDMLSRNDAAVFAWKSRFKESRLYSSVSSVCFSFSPTKEEADIIVDAIIGIIRKKRGSI